MDAGGKGMFGQLDKNSAAAKWYKQLASQTGLTGERKPKAIVVISAHWESPKADTVLVTSQESHPSLFYDYSGFPESTYELKYPSPGSPTLAKKLVGLIEGAKIGLKAVEDKKRNLDHGVFIPLLLIYPEADIPVVQLSLPGTFDPSLYIKLGAALAPLRDEGILLIGSGSLTHGRFATGEEGKTQAHLFVSKLSSILTSSSSSSSSPSSLTDGKTSAMKASSSSRGENLIEWEKLPHARLAHQREEHLLPLHFTVGAAGEDQATQLCDFWAETLSLRSFLFG